MRVIICGAGQVGSNIAASLVHEGKDVTIIDNDPALIADVNDALDAKGIVGHASSPDSLKAAGAPDTDLLIAVTASDEVNMIACQIGHSLFGIPKKIARIRQQAYLQPEWSNLFSRAHMPIDVIISPEVAVAHNIERRLGFPGTTYVAQLNEDRVYMVGLLCEEDCPVLNTPLEQLYRLFDTLSFRVVALTRQGHTTIMPAEDTQLMPGDECFIIVQDTDLKRVMHSFGHQEEEARKILISGGGRIGFGLAQNLLKNNPGIQIKVIEHDQGRARFLSEHLQRAIILRGSGLDGQTLKNASIDNTETFIAVTNDDETNIMGAILAKQYGADRSISLVNNPIYVPLVGTLGIDSVVSPGATVVASIMRHVRKGRVKSLHSVHDGRIEVLESEVSESSIMINKTIAELDLPEDIAIVALVKDDGLVFPDASYMVKPDDHLIILNTRTQTHAVEKLFSMQVDLF